MHATFGAEIIIYEPIDEIVDKIIEELNERKIIEVSGSFLPNGHVEMDVTRYENARDIGFIFKPTNDMAYKFLTHWNDTPLISEKEMQEIEFVLNRLNNQKQEE